MKKMIVSLLCAFVAAGVFAQVDHPWVLDVSGKITGLSSGSADLVPTPHPATGFTILQASVSGYLIIDPFSYYSYSEDSAGTFVLVNKKNNQAVFEYDIPVLTWNDGQTLLLFVDFSPVHASVLGSIAMNGPTLKSLSATGAGFMDETFTPNWSVVNWPGYCTLSLRLDRAFTTAALAANIPGDEVVWNYLRALRYSITEYRNK